ncbi:M56 family metallopeptidase [Amycolatopsis thermophila]|uniref:Zn-dependent protease with chaperone function n=1 Tax=Amycolatopsis thermophila TaxID=206084 RepID=A0ABU0F347_9PSEU|nr:M56 family metallopeptidase [Amycolatopsis thermophila]MDQ0382004.1 Zn-dependent protease with chaperone function [Amycolatopsis thermophila]
MIVGLSVLAGAVAAAWLMPGWLRAMDLRRRDPVLLIVCWLLSMLGVALAAVASVVLLLHPTHGSLGSLATAVHDCWDAIEHGSPPAVEQMGGTLGGVVLIALALRLMVVGSRGIQRRARARRRHLATLRLAGRSDGAVPATLWLAHDRPLAFSVGGRRGVVVATEGLSRYLDDGAVAAVLAHERAHLAGRHHQLIALADALRAVLPILPLFRQAPKALRELVELAADVAAARRCGKRAVRAALLGVSGVGAPEIALAMARDAVDVRLARLEQGSLPPAGTRRALACGLAGFTAVVLPFLAGAALMVMVALVACVVG